jgi:DNA repair protein RadC
MRRKGAWCDMVRRQAVDPRNRRVYKDAIVASAASIIVAHNHPSGDPTPSIEDRRVTQRLYEAGQILGIDLLDHIVIGDNRWASLKQLGAF